MQKRKIPFPKSAPTHLSHLLREVARKLITVHDNSREPNHLQVCLQMYTSRGANCIAVPKGHPSSKTPISRNKVCTHPRNLDLDLCLILFFLFRQTNAKWKNNKDLLVQGLQWIWINTAAVLHMFSYTLFMTPFFYYYFYSNFYLKKRVLTRYH